MMKVIIIDDEKAILHNILDEIIEEKSIEYKLFTNPLKAIDYMSKDITAAFLDINMPQMNGLELARKLIEINPMVRITFITGFYHNEEEIKKEFKNNLEAFLYKPLNSVEFKNVLNRVEAFSNKNHIKAHMFGTFDLFVNGVLIDFSCDKAKEMLALLIVYRGRTLTKNKIIEHLWPEKEYNKADVLYRHARWKLMNTLKLYNVDGMVEFSNAKMNLKCQEDIECDYYKHLDGKDIFEETDNKYNDDDIFLREYDWALEYMN